MLNVAPARNGGKPYVVAGGIDRTAHLITPNGREVVRKLTPVCFHNLFRKK